MPLLNKRDVEALLRDYDIDPVAALTTALRLITGREGDSWAELTHFATADPTHRVALEEGDPAALDALAAELNELHTLDARRLAHEAERNLPR